MGYTEWDGTHQSKFLIKGSEPWQIFTAYVHASTINSNDFQGLNENDNRGTIESAKQFKITKAGWLKRVYANVTINSKNAATTLGFRINGNSYGTMSYNAAETGQKEVLLNQKININDLINFFVNTSASSSGSLTVAPYGAEISFTW